MGTLKALLDWAGRPLIIHQIVALRQAGADEVVVVLGHRGDELQARIGANRDVYDTGNVRLAHNSDYALGKTTSIKVGLQAIDPDPDRPGDILMLNVDQPRSASVIRQVLDAHHRGSGALITIPTHQGKGGHPIAVKRSLLPELLAIDETTQGMRAVTQRHAESTQRIELGAPELLWGQHARAVPGGAGCRRPDCTGPGSPALLAADRRAAQRRAYPLCHCERSVAISSP